MLSQTVEYALRAVVYLAGEEQGASTTERIAEATQVPAAYLAKVIQSLRKGDLVRCTRGIGGGVVLCRALAQISVLDVVNAVEPLQRIRRCPLGLAAHRQKLCPLHARLDRALADLEETFRTTSLADLTRDGGLSLEKDSRAPKPRKPVRKKG